MSSTTFINLRINSSEQLKESVSEPSPNTKLYLAYGKITGWDNESSPDVANNSTATEYQIWENMIGGKKVFGSDISHAIPRINWASNTVYYAYDHMTTDLHNPNNKFYVVTSDYNVYKCIANNYGANSTTEPTTVNPNTVITTADGYVWKYMYSISDSDLMRFTTTNYVPVKTLPANDGSIQWQVQDNSVEGAIYSILVTNGGSNYSNNQNISVTISGDGASATATANINVTSGMVETISMTDYGSGYTYATVAISGGGGTGANARAIMSPVGGHGSNPLYELGGCNLIFNPTLSGIEDTDLPTTNDFRQISILKDPVIFGTSNGVSNVRFVQAYTVITSGTGNYLEDELVYQGTSPELSTFSGRVVSWTLSSNTALLINTSGTPRAGTLIGANSFTARYVTETTPGELKKYSGQLLYLNNITPITRSADQTEDFKIVLKF